jgi:hypothetical protein
LSVDGFVLTPLLGFSSTPQIVNSGGVYNLQSTSNVGSGGADTILTRADGGSFSMVSIQAAALGGDTGSFGIAVAPLSGPGAFLLGDYLTGTPAPSTFTTYDLTGYSALSDVMAINQDPVSENGDQFAIAAITVSFTDAPLPEPATIGLFGLAVTGLGFMRRRHSAVR